MLIFYFEELNSNQTHACIYFILKNKSKYYNHWINLFLLNTKLYCFQGLLGQIFQVFKNWNDTESQNP